MRPISSVVIDLILRISAGLDGILLFGRDRFLRESDDDLACLFSVACPVNDAAGARAVLLELFEISVEMRHGVLADALAGETKLLPNR